LEPKPGLVIRYAYLWREQAEAGRDEAVKDRPCAVVLATKRSGGSTIVVVAPITHAPPRDARFGVAIPASAKARLGLDDEPSWVVTTDLNYFTWPGPDIRPVDPRSPGRGFAYGQLSEKLTNAILGNVRDRLRDGQAKTTSRNEPALPRKNR
jgi:hypothetical protein